MRVGADAAREDGVEAGFEAGFCDAACTHELYKVKIQAPMSPSALRRQIGQLLIAGFDGQQMPVELKALAREFGLGGVILFARNIGEPEQVAELCYEASRLVPEMPAWVSVDQEGGRVARLKAPFTEWPPMATLGRSGDVALAGAVRAGAGLRAESGRASRSTTRRCSTSTRIRRIR